MAFSGPELEQRAEISKAGSQQLNADHSGLIIAEAVARLHRLVAAQVLCKNSIFTQGLAIMCLCIPFLKSYTAKTDTMVPGLWTAAFKVHAFALLYPAMQPRAFQKALK